MADHLQMLPRKASHQGTARYFKGSVARNDEPTTIIGRAVVAGENSGRQELSSSVYALLSLSTDMALLIVIDHKLHKIRNTQKAARRSLEGAFKRLVNDLAEEMGLDFRFHPKAYAALYEEFKSFGAAYFSSFKKHANHANRVTVRLEDSKLLREPMRLTNPSHPLAKYKPKQPIDSLKFDN